MNKEPIKVHPKVLAAEAAAVNNKAKPLSEIEGYVDEKELLDYFDQQDIPVAKDEKEHRDNMILFGASAIKIDTDKK